MRNIKLVVLPMLVIFGLLMTGFAYACWSQTLYIEGSVESGSFTVGMFEKTVVEKYEWPPGSGLYYDGEWLGKDVGKVESEWGDLKTDPITGKMGYESVILEVTNAYPSYRVHVTIGVKNLGTIPAHFVDILISGRNETDDEDLTFEWIDMYEHGILKDKGKEIINVDIVDFVCRQLHPCSSTKGEVDFHFKQEIEQGHTYSIRVEIVAVQWNAA